MQSLCVDCGIEDPEHQVVVKEALTKLFAGACVHPFLEKWDGVYHCCDCKEVMSTPARVAQEQKIEDAMVLEPVSVEEYGKQSRCRGVTIGFLVDFTTQHDIWHIPTWQVRREYVLPATAATRCRYVELPHMRESGHVGAAATFISHTCE